MSERRIRVTCSWCHEFGQLGVETHCKSCGHELGVPMMACQCQACQGTDKSLDDLEAELAQALKETLEQLKREEEG